MYRFTIGGAMPGPVSLRIIDASGRVVRTMKADAASGGAAMVWNHDEAGSGVYCYLVQAGSSTVHGKLTVPK